MKMEVLAFDVGEDIVGILDLGRGRYEPYRGKRKAIAARRLIRCEGTIVSFNGNRFDLPELARLLGKTGVNDLDIQAEHLDMSVIASIDRWPPDPGTMPILGDSLLRAYAHYFPDEPEIDPPSDLNDGYQIDNWRDCWMAGQLWRKLVMNELSTT